MSKRQLQTFLKDMNFLLSLYKAFLDLKARKMHTILLKKLQDQLEPITENKDRFPTAEERWPRAGETIKEVKQVEI